MGTREGRSGGGEAAKGAQVADQGTRRVWMPAVSLCGLLAVGHHFLPYYVGKQAFIPMVMFIRFLLLVPLLLPRLLGVLGILRPGDEKATRLSPSPGTLVGIVAGILAIKVGCSEVYSGGISPERMWRELNGTPAVSALGWDMVIAVVGLMLLKLIGVLEGV